MQKMCTIDDFNLNVINKEDKKVLISFTRRKKLLYIIYSVEHTHTLINKQANFSTRKL